MKKLILSLMAIPLILLFTACQKNTNQIDQEVNFSKAGKIHNHYLNEFFLAFKQNNLLDIEDFLRQKFVLNEPVQKYNITPLVTAQI